VIGPPSGTRTPPSRAQSRRGREGRLHQHEVGAFLDILLDLAQRFFGVGPFAIRCLLPGSADRRSHQMDPAKREEALREVEQGYRGRRRPRAGEARPSYLDVNCAREGGVRVPDGGLSRERRVLDAGSRRQKRLARRTAGDARVVDGDSARRRRRHHHVLPRARPRARLPKTR